MPGRYPIDATDKMVTIPDQYFFYRIRDNHIVEIRPDPTPDGAPHGILKQISNETAG